MLDFLTEELHNHLYLKSFYTESRWKTHTQGQTDCRSCQNLRCRTLLTHFTSVPSFVVEPTAKSVFDYASTSAAIEEDDANAGTTAGQSSSSGRPQAKREQTKLAQFLARLAARPANLPSTGEAIDDGVPLEDLLGRQQLPSPQQQLQAGGRSADEPASVPRSGSVASLSRPGLTPSASASSGLGMPASSSMKAGLSAGLGTTATGEGSGAWNPEQDSFSYIESILESLAYLGKLGHCMDVVLQRAPIEVYNLIEGTVGDVDERNAPVRRDSLRLARLGAGASPKMLFSGTLGGGGQSQTTAYSLMIRSSMSGVSSGAGEEAGVHAVNTEILLDFFWTAFSKLDAVLQGFRALHEVVQRIVGRKSFKDGSMPAAQMQAQVAGSKSGGTLFSLYDIWRPIQFEVSLTCSEASMSVAS